MLRSLAIKMLPSNKDSLFDIAFGLLKRKIEGSSSARITETVGEMEVVLDLDEGIGKEGFRIFREPDQRIIITGNDDIGLLYGIGKFLRSSTYDNEEFGASLWTGTSIPVKEIRGIYFATHFHNFYHDAPIEKVEQYISDLLLWGMNTLCVWFDMHHYKSMQDPDAAAMITRLRKILAYARKMYMKTCLLMIGNEAFDESPEYLRAQFTAGHDGYTRQLAGHYHVELCPSKPDGLELLLEWRKEVFESFSDVKLDYICIWPYDQGGCSCSECKPWGSNGYLKIARPLAELAKSIFPDAKIILSTWLFDSFTSGEWEGLTEALGNDSEWVDYLMAEFLEGTVPGVIIGKGFPGNFPCLGFPEISMYGAVPWGGFGANPIPERISNMWNDSERCFVGGFPYSEGIFDDINKFIYSRLYWGDVDSVHDAVKEYIRSVFGSLYTDDIATCISLFEKTIARNRLDAKGKNHNYPDNKIPWEGEQRFVIDNTNEIENAFSVMLDVDQKLPSRVKNSWRWRILFLRSLIDRELLCNGFKTNDRVEKAYGELAEIYHAQYADYCVAPADIGIY